MGFSLAAVAVMPHLHVAALSSRPRRWAAVPKCSLAQVKEAGWGHTLAAVTVGLHTCPITVLISEVSKWLGCMLGPAAELAWRVHIVLFASPG